MWFTVRKHEFSKKNISRARENRMHEKNSGDRQNKTAVSVIWQIFIPKILFVDPLWNVFVFFIRQ